MAAKAARMVVTGGVGGLGMAMAETWLKSSSAKSVLLLDRVSDAVASGKLAELRASQGASRVAYAEHDVMDGAGFRSHLESSSDVSVVVLNAGVGHLGFHDWEETIDVNLKAVIGGTETALDVLRGSPPAEGASESTAPVVVCVSSLAGLVPAPFSAAYCASKAGVVSFVRALHRPSKKYDHVRVHALCPSFADTDLVSNITSAAATDSAAAHFTRVAVDAQGGLMTPAFVAEALLAMVEDANAEPVMYVTPQTGPQYETFPLHESVLALARSATPSRPSSPASRD